MSEPNPSNYQITFTELVHRRRDPSLLEWESLLVQYIAHVLPEGERLRFHLSAGQPLYDTSAQKVQTISKTDQRVEVYLDPARRLPFDPYDYIAIGESTMETFYVRLDFTGRPGFDTTIYNRLRLEHVLADLSQSCPQHYKRLMLLYKFRRNCRAFLAEREWMPSPEPIDDFFEFFPLQ